MIWLDHCRPPNDAPRFRQRPDEDAIFSWRARCGECLGHLEREPHLPGHNHVERLGRIVLPQDHLARRDAPHSRVRGKRIDVFGREGFEERRFPNEFGGRFHQAPAFGIPPEAAGLTRISRVCSSLLARVAATRFNSR